MAPFHATHEYQLWRRFGVSETAWNTHLFGWKGAWFAGWNQGDVWNYVVHITSTTRISWLGNLILEYKGWIGEDRELESRKSQAFSPTFRQINLLQARLKCKFS